MLTTYDKSDRFRLTNTLLDILHRLYVIKLLSTVGTKSLLSLSFDMAKMGSNKNQMVTKMTFLVR